MGDVTARATVHGYQQFVTGSTEGGTAIKLPPHVDDLYFVIPGGGAWGQNWNLTFNDLNNEFQVRSGGGGKDVFIDLGGGDDTVRSNNNRMTVYGRDGNDRISFGNPSSFADGGRGNDTISGGNSADTIYGGAGDDRLTGGSGADTIHGGPGNDYIHGGPGADTIHIDGGVDEVWGGSEANTFIVHRTGDVSTIKDLKSADTLDLSDWAGIQPVSVVQSGSDVIVSAALERLVCQNIDAATVTGTITGATVA